jgi:hypothetical protein
MELEMKKEVELKMGFQHCIVEIDHSYIFSRLMSVRPLSFPLGGYRNHAATPLYDIGFSLQRCR